MRLWTEEPVVCPRVLGPAFERALDLLFIQAFKSHGSLYSLCVLGPCEDAAPWGMRLDAGGLMTLLDTSRRQLSSHRAGCPVKDPPRDHCKLPRLTLTKLECENIRKNTQEPTCGGVRKYVI